MLIPKFYRVKRWQQYAALLQDTLKEIKWIENLTAKGDRSEPGRGTVFSDNSSGYWQVDHGEF